MQPSTNNHYLSEEFNDNFFNNDEDKNFDFHSPPIINDRDENENYSRGTVNGKKNIDL
jgi:hypothetical protein